MKYKRLKRNFRNAERVVVKVGSALLTREVEGEGRFLDSIVFELLARQVDELMAAGREIVLVSSGAVASGKMQLGKGAPSNRITYKQALAAIGQSHLMNHYEWAFRPKGRTTAQVLLTHEDLENRHRYLNARRTLNMLIELGVVPVVNENDTVAVEEIKVGDNDTLSAQVASLIDADLLVILTVVDGLMDEGRILPSVDKIDDHILSISRGPGGELGTGGMLTKVEAARVAGIMDIPTVIASGRQPGILARILANEEVGTYFPPSGKKISQRKHWIVCARKPKGVIVVDEGAKKAVVKQGKSLLPKGIIEVRGEFKRGEAVGIAGEDGVEFARGLVAYSSSDLDRIKGSHSKNIEEILGYHLDDEAVHRDDLTIVDREC